MKKNIIVLQTLLIIASSLFPLSLFAMDVEVAKQPEFVFAIFATKRSRADLIEKAQILNIQAYNINSESEIDLENNCIKKVWTRDKGRWVKVEQAPLPEVVYDFGVYKNARKRKEKAKVLREQLRSRDIPFVNPEDAMGAVNDKLLFAKVMHDNEIPHPETREYTESNLKKMLAKHNPIFLKPTMGSKGYGIIIIEKIAGTRHAVFSLKYKIKYRGRWVAITDQSNGKKELHAAIALAQKRLRRTRTPYLVQEGINAFRYDEQTAFYKGQQTDFRVNVQRGRDGMLVSTGLVMRVGGNLSQGGRPADHNEVLKGIVAKSGLAIETIKSRVNAVAIETHLALEKFAGREIGDLGMDLVVASDGSPYIVEANHKNGYAHTYLQKNPDVDKLFDLPSSLELCNKIDEEHEERLLEYARYLVTKARIALKQDSI